MAGIASKIFFIGMPGSGKSYIGRRAAGKLGLPFIDLDEAIVEFTGKSINEIFNTEGETYFRELEARLLREITHKNRAFLMATGGGTPCFHDNMAFINAHGASIFLNTPLETIASGLLEKGTQERPLLKDFSSETLLKELRAKFSDREKFYRKAKLTIDPEAWDVEKTVKEVAAFVKRLNESSF